MAQAIVRQYTGLYKGTTTRTGVVYTIGWLARRKQSTSELHRPVEITLPRTITIGFSMLRASFRIRHCTIIVTRQLWFRPVRSMATEKVKSFWIKGLTAPPVTPFKENGDLNLDIIPNYVKHFQEYGISNAYVTGTTGEGHSLTIPERKEVAKAWVKESKGKLSAVMIHVGAGNLRESQELAAHAQSIGADAIACVGPTYHKPQSLEQYVYYMRDVASSAPELPFYLYDIDFYTGIPWTAEQFFSMAQHHIPTLKGTKHTSKNFVSMNNCLTQYKGRYQILMGSDDSYMLGLCIGLHGTVCNTFCGGALRRMEAAFEAGNITEARKEQQRAFDIIGLIKKYKLSVPGGSKAILRAIGMPVGQPRCPLEPVPDSTVDSLRKDLEKIGFFEWGQFRQSS